MKIKGFFNIASQALALGLVLSFAGGAQAEGKRYIVTFKDSNVFNFVQKRQQNLQGISGDASGLKFMGTDAHLSQTLENLEMAIVESKDAQAIEALKANPAIAAVEEEIFFDAPKPIGVAPTAGNLTVLDKKFTENTWGVKAVKAPEAWNITKGAGIRVAVLDTGLDKDHPDLKNRFEKGKNFYGRAPGDSAPYEFWDDVGHGTHCAGTILADGSGSGLLGVAPEATLLMGRVCGTMSCSSVAIVQGVNWAISEGVDVISMSLGGPMATLAERRAYKAAEDAKIVIVAASGNSGNGKVSFPAAVDTTLAVGALDPSLNKAGFSQWGPELDVVAPGVEVISTVPQGSGRESKVEIDMGSGFSEVKSMAFQGASDNQQPISGKMVFAGLGSNADFAGKSLIGQYALVQRGEITFIEKVNNAKKAGAIGVIIFNNADGLISGGLTQDGSNVAVPVAMIEKTLGESIVKSLASGGEASVAVSMERTNYASFQGTSMATPHVAGVIALMKSVNKTASALDFRNTIKATATVLAGPNNENQLGSGLVNAEAAVQAMASNSIANNFMAGVIGF